MRSRAKEVLHGHDRKGLQRYRCRVCQRTFVELRKRPLDHMRVPYEKALLCLNLLVEGNSIRSIERVTGVGKRAILALLTLAGRKCERLMEKRINGVAVKDVQADEMWGFVGCKEKTKQANSWDSDSLGSAWTFVAMESRTKLVVAWHLGNRTFDDTLLFVEKISRATDGRFQLSTDGWTAYADAIVECLGVRVDDGQIIKSFQAIHYDDRRYSPQPVKEVIKLSLHGKPEFHRISTSHIERQNLTIRMMIRRLTRLTNAFSKKWENLRAALALHFAYYNFCRIHRTLRCTPAMEAGITKHLWDLKDLLTK